MFYYIAKITETHLKWVKLYIKLCCLQKCFLSFNVHTNRQGILLKNLVQWIRGGAWDSAFLGSS